MAQVVQHLLRKHRALNSNPTWPPQKKWGEELKGEAKSWRVSWGAPELRDEPQDIGQERTELMENRVESAGRDQGENLLLS
jgi:hypothetical protein